MIYLDHAATSFPKPREVLSEMTRCMRFYGGNPGRGSHSLSLAAAEKVYACRRAAAELVGSRHPERLAFTLNATSAINTVVKGLLRTGDHVLISDMEHNAVLRPVARLAREGRITYTVFPTMLLEEGRSSKIKGFISQKGNKFDAFLKIEDGKCVFDFNDNN